MDYPQIKAIQGKSPLVHSAKIGLSAFLKYKTIQVALLYDKTAKVNVLSVEKRTQKIFIPEKVFKYQKSTQVNGSFHGS